MSTLTVVDLSGTQICFDKPMLQNVLQEVQTLDEDKSSVRSVSLNHNEQVTAQKVGHQEA